MEAATITLLFFWTVCLTLKSLYIYGRTTKILRNAYRTKYKEIYIKGGEI